MRRHHLVGGLRVFALSPCLRQHEFFIGGEHWKFPDLIKVARQVAFAAQTGDRCYVRHCVYLLKFARSLDRDAAVGVLWHFRHGLLVFFRVVRFVIVKKSISHGDFKARRCESVIKMP